MSPPPSTPTFSTGRGFTDGSSVPLSFLSAVVAKKISMSRRATGETASCAEELRLALEPPREPVLIAVLDRLERAERRRVVPLRLRERHLARLAEEHLAAEEVLLERERRDLLDRPALAAPLAPELARREGERPRARDLEQERRRARLVHEPELERPSAP